MALKKLLQYIKQKINSNILSVKSTFMYILAAMLSALISVLINPFMAKHLSPYDYAVMGYFNSFNLFLLPVINFSLVSYYQRNYFRIADDRKKVVQDTVLIGLSVFGLFALVVTFISFYLFIKLSKVSFPFFPYVFLCYTPIYLNNFTNIYLINCRLERKAKKYAIFTITTSLISAVLAILLVVFNDFGAKGRMVATLIATVLITAYCLKKLVQKLEFDPKIIREAFAFGWPLSLSALLWYFLDGIDRAMLEKLHDTNLLGYYSVGFQMATYLTVFTTAISNTFEPDIYQAISQNKKKKLLKTIAVAIILYTIPNLLFILIAPLIIGILTFNRYIGSANFARIFALNNIAVSICFTTFTLLVGYGYTKIKFFLLIIGSIASILIYKSMIHYYGFYGAAWGHVISVTMMALMVLIFIVFKSKKKLSFLLSNRKNQFKLVNAISEKHVL